MARYIDAEQLLKAMEYITNDTTCPMHIAAEIDQYISLAPTADVVEVKHGEWSRGTEPSGSVYAHCSACGRKMNYSCYGYAYCALCGAKMDGRSAVNDRQRDYKSYRGDVIQLFEQ